MPAKIFQVQSYRVILGRSLSLMGAKCSALINCYGPDGFRMDIYFKNAESPDVANTASIADKVGRIFLPGDQFDSYLHLLQTESPVNAEFYEETPDSNQLYTGNEPVGEQEGP